MHTYTIRYAKGGTTEHISANNHLDAITKSASKVIPKARFFETTDSDNFIVTDTLNNTIKYYRMITA